MIIVLSGIFLIGIALAAYALLPGKDNVGIREDGAPVLSPHFPQNTAAPIIPAYNLEAEQLKVSIDELRKNNEQLKAENAQLRNDLLAKIRELEKTITQDSGVNKELADAKEKAGSLEKENKQLTEKASALEGQIAGYKKEIDSQKAVIEKYQQLGEQVAKKEYDELNNKLVDALAKLRSLEVEATKLSGEAQKTAALDKEKVALTDKIKILEVQAVALTAENSDALGKVKIMETQIEQYKKELEKSAAEALSRQQTEAQDSVPKKEYEELKKKLEEAEEVLKMMHGSGE